ncbi:hypothetical protein [Streptomyces shenzhenensis]|uniref:hypothetical protein n=1 Tax=Streptomyces shenzhenensis TaxID=943815 RepID=UPI0033E09347
MNVDDVVAEKIAAARARAEAAKRRRAAFSAARQRGLAHRHAAKLRRLSDSESPSEPDDPDDVVTEVTEAEWHTGVRTALARLGLTYAELEDQARRRDFTSAQAHSLWTSIGGTVNPQLLEENS